MLLLKLAGFPWRKHGRIAEKSGHTSVGCACRAQQRHWHGQLTHPALTNRFANFAPAVPAGVAIIYRTVKMPTGGRGGKPGRYRASEIGGMNQRQPLPGGAGTQRDASPNQIQQRLHLNIARPIHGRWAQNTPTKVRVSFEHLLTGKFTACVVRQLWATRSQGGKQKEGDRTAGLPERFQDPLNTFDIGANEILVATTPHGTGAVDDSPYSVNSASKRRPICKLGSHYLARRV
jgi:hypothetical protein